MPLGPLMAAAIVAASPGRAAFRLGRRLRGWSAPPGGTPSRCSSPIAVDAAIVLVNHLFGAPLPTAEQAGGLAERVRDVFVLMLVLVGIGEEAGWSAFAAPLLRERAFLTQWAMLSGVRIFWHLPLMVTGLLPWTIGIVGNAAWQMVVLCVLNSTGGKWSLVAVWHATLNAVGGGFVFTMVEGADKARLGVLFARRTPWWRSSCWR